MNLYAFNAVRSPQTTVGILVDFDPERFPSPEVQAQIEHRDKCMFRCMAFVPVWAKDAYAPWFKWQCLRANMAYTLPPFKARGIEVNWGITYSIRVLALRKVYDPFNMSIWLWGVQVTETDVRNFKAANYRFAEHRFHGATTALDHTKRIKYLTTYPSPTPIVLATDYALPHSRVAVEDGNHRFAAAIIRGDGFISAYLAGNPVTIEAYLY